LRRLAEARPAQWRIRQRLGDALGRLGRHREAADALIQARNAGGDRLTGDPEWWHQLGLALLASGDNEGHRRLCREMMMQYGPDGLGPVTELKRDFLGDIVQVCCAGTHPVGAWEFLLDKARADKDDLQIAMLLARAGRFVDAKEHLDKVGGGDYGVTFGEALRAIVHQRLGNLEEARNNLQNARSMIRDYGKSYLEWSAWDSGSFGWTWDDMLALKLCTREAEILIEGNDVGFPADPFARREKVP
jgi:hypothetical protein